MGFAIFLSWVPLSLVKCSYFVFGVIVLAWEEIACEFRQDLVSLLRQDLQRAELSVQEIQATVATISRDLETKMDEWCPQ